MLSTSTTSLPVVDAAASGGAQADAIAHMAVRHATAVAVASIEKKLMTTSSTRETVQLTRTLTELQRCSLQSELGFLDTLLKMDEDQILTTLFSLFDSDGSRLVDKNELAKNLKKLDQCSFSESVDTALLSIQAFDSNGDGSMDIDEFTEFLEDLVNGLECQFVDLAQFLTLRVAFCDNGSAVLNGAVVSLIQDSTSSVTSVEDFDDVVVEVRMMLLFQMMAGASGVVKFNTLVRSLYHVTETMDQEQKQRGALLMCTAGDTEARVLDYVQFSSLLLNVVTAGGLHFHDVANSVTLAYCKNDARQSDLAGVFVSDDTLLALVMTDHIKRDTDNNVVDALQYGRMNRLFDLWDIDHSGDLDFEEVVLGFRKFHEAKSVDQTLEESIQTILSFDENKDGNLSREEFAAFVVAFADAAQVSVEELIDFMVVTSALKDNNLTEQAYIESIKDRRSDEILRRQRACDGSSPLSLGSLWKTLGPKQ